MHLFFQVNNYNNNKVNNCNKYIFIIVQFFLSIMNDPNYVLFEYSIDEEIFDDYILRFINYFQNREPLKD